MNNKIKTIIAFTLVLVALLTFGVTSYADVIAYENYTHATQWYGMGLTSVKLELQALPSGDADFSFNDRLNFLPDMTFTHGFSPVPVLTGNTGIFQSDSTNTTYALDEYFSPAYMTQSGDYVSWNRDTGGLGYTTTLLDVKSDEYWSTNATFYFSPFYYNSRTQEKTDYLCIAPYTVNRQVTEMMVRYEYDIIELQYYPTTDRWIMSDVQHKGEWDVINDEEANDGQPICFLPKTLYDRVGDSNSADFETRAIISNLTVTIIDFQATKDPSTSYDPNLCNYIFCDINGGTDMIKLDYTDGGANVLQLMEDHGFLTENETDSMFDWLINSVDGFLDTEIVPSITVGGILAVCAGIGLLMLLLKLVAGG